MSITIATTADAKAIANIVSTSNKDIAKAFEINKENNPKHPSFYNKDWVLSDFARNEEYFIYIKNATAVGCVAFEHPRPGVAYLNRLAVLPEHRHNKIGEQLVQHIVTHAKKQGIQKISIGIIAEHLELKNWYIKLGFVEGSVKAFPHLPFNVQYMSLEL